MSNELVEREPNNMPAVASESATILSIIQHAASSPEVDIDKMERLMAMHERMQSRQAETAYSEALSAMQTVLPEIAERGGIKNSSGKNQSTYALWEDINDAIKPVLSQFGFALSFRIDSSAGIKVTGVLSHKSGHKETTDILLPADTSGSKNSVQAIASSVSYGKRYTAGALLNLTSRGEDDDGNSAVKKKTVTDIQARQIQAQLDKCLPDTKAAFEKLHGSAADVPAAEFNDVLTRLQAAANRKPK